MEALSANNGQPVDENEFIDASRLVYDGVRDIRKAVLMIRVRRSLCKENYSFKIQTFPLTPNVDVLQNAWPNESGWPITMPNMFSLTAVRSWLNSHADGEQFSADGRHTDM